MKVAIGYQIQKGPWGGGNSFAKSLSEYFKCKGVKVVYDLKDNDIDIILLTDPRGLSPQITIDAGKIIRYILFKNNKSIIVHRINECDERKGTTNMNSLLKRANYVADHTIFIATWLKNLDIFYNNKNTNVILNGGDDKVFNCKNGSLWNKTEPLKLVTHHWGGNNLKGMDVYIKLDELLDDIKWKKFFQFTYIGNIPGNYKFKNVNHIKPCSGKILAKNLKKNHIYLTASINEPGGMHHIEGALCGLPVLFRDSGSLPEYCEKYGLSFQGVDDIVKALKKMRENYKIYKEKIKSYDKTSNKMCSEYYTLFNELYNNRRTLVKKRNLFKNPWLVLRNQIPI